MADSTFSSDFHTICLNIVGGAIVAIAAWLYDLMRKRCRKWMLRLVLGQDFDASGKYYIAYASFMLPPPHITHPYQKTPLSPTSPRQLSSANFSIENPVSGAEMRAAAYLAALFGKAKACVPTFCPDNDLDACVNLSFIALGSHASNIKTDDAFSHPANDLVKISDKSFVNPKTGQPVIQITPSLEYDYGVILRLCPTQHPARTWIVCAGIGEWGTSGAARFLANKWPILFWHIIRRRKKQFAFIVKVRRGQDESADPCWRA